jgi:hypothetical protein
VLQLASRAIGEFTSTSTQPDPASGERQADLRAMDVALGLGHARTDFAAGVGPIIEGDYSPILRHTFAPLANTTLTEFLASADSEHLRKTTRDLSAFAQSLAAASQEFDRTLAKDAFGFRRAALLARSDRMRQAQTGLMWTLILEKSAEKFYDLGLRLFRQLPHRSEARGDHGRRGDDGHSAGGSRSSHALRKPARRSRQARAASRRMRFKS